MMRRVRVLHVYKTSMPASFGGVETFIDSLCSWGERLGLEGSVLALHPDAQSAPISMDGYIVHQAKQNFFVGSTGFSFAAFAKFKKLAANADLVHYHFPNPFSDMLHFLHSPLKPSVVTYHSDIIRQRYLLNAYRPLMRHFLRSVDRIVATSPNYLFSSEVLQEYREKVSVIPLGVHLSNYESVDGNRLRFWRERFSEPFFLFVGALRYYKGLHFLLDAVVGSNIKIVIAGCGELESELKTQAHALRLENVCFLGSVDPADKAVLLSLCVGFVFPSHLRSEAFGVALLEAAAAGRPLISCEIGTGTSFVNISGETGLVVKPASPAELRNAMEFILENPGVAENMGKKAKIRVAEKFSIEAQCQSYNQLYRELLDARLEI